MLSALSLSFSDIHASNLVKLASYWKQPLKRFSLWLSWENLGSQWQMVFQTCWR